jgi:hypothetical protein
MSNVYFLLIGNLAYSVYKHFTEGDPMYAYASLIISLSLIFGAILDNKEQRLNKGN